MTTVDAAPVERTDRTGSSQRGDDTRVQWWRGRTGAGIVLILTGTVFITPLVFVFVPPFLDGASGLRQLIAQEDLGTVLSTTLWLTFGAAAIALVVGTALAWWSTTLPPRWGWLRALPMAPLVIPQIALVTGFAFLLSPRAGLLNVFIRGVVGSRSDLGPINVYEVPWIVIIVGLTLSAFVFIFVRTALSNLGQDMIDAAAASGAGSIRMFFTVVLPLLRPAHVFAAMTVFLLGLGQFTAPLILGRQSNVKVLTTEMFRLVENYPPNLALASSFAVPLLLLGIFFLFLQRVAIQGNKYEMAGNKGSGHPLKSGGPLAIASLLAYGVFVVALPLIALVIVSLQPYLSGVVDPAVFTFNNYISLFQRSDLSRAIVNSVVFALAAVVIAIPVGHACAQIIHHRSHMRVIGNLQDLIVSMPLGIPGVVFGIGFLVAYLNSPVPLYGQPIGMILLYVTLTITYSVRMQLTSLVGLGASYTDAAAASGAGLLRRLITVQLPMMRPAIGGAASLCVVMAMQEFTASMFVRSPKTNVMSTVLYDLNVFGSFPQTAAMALVMSAISGVIVLAALRVGGSNVLGNMR